LSHLPIADFVLTRLCVTFCGWGGDGNTVASIHKRRIASRACSYRGWGKAEIDNANPISSEA